MTIRKGIFLPGILLVFGFCLASDQTRPTVVSSKEVTALVNPAGSAEVQMLLTPDRTNDKNIYLGRGQFLPGATIPEHVHETSSEIVYIFSGSGRLKIAGESYEIKEGDAVYIPQNTTHLFENTGKVPVDILQFYSPAGPEERFRNWKTK
jgi:putative monooxygenase